MLRRQLSGLLRGERRRRLLDALIADVVLTWLAARRMAETACEIDADPREAHWAMSYVAMHEGRFGEAVARLRQALAVDASCADAYALLALIHIYEGAPTFCRRHGTGAHQFARGTRAQSDRAWLDRTPMRDDAQRQRLASALRELGL
jgi:hypothetical protein